MSTELAISVSAIRKTERICPMAQSGLANCAALSSFDCARISLKKRTRTRTVGRGRHPPGRREEEAAHSAFYVLFTGGGERLREAGESPSSRSTHSGSGGEDLLALLAQLALRPDVPVERHRIGPEFTAECRTIVLKVNDKRRWRSR